MLLLIARRDDCSSFVFQCLPTLEKLTSSNLSPSYAWPRWYVPCQIIRQLVHSFPVRGSLRFSFNRCKARRESRARTSIDTTVCPLLLPKLRGMFRRIDYCTMQYPAATISVSERVVMRRHETSNSINNKILYRRKLDGPRSNRNPQVRPQLLVPQPERPYHKPLRAKGHTICNTKVYERYEQVSSSCVRQAPNQGR